MQLTGLLRVGKSYLPSVGSCGTYLLLERIKTMLGPGEMAQWSWHSVPNLMAGLCSLQPPWWKAELKQASWDCHEHVCTQRYNCKVSRTAAGNGGCMPTISVLGRLGHREILPQGKQPSEPSISGMWVHCDDQGSGFSSLSCRKASFIF